MGAGRGAVRPAARSPPEPGVFRVESPPLWQFLPEHLRAGAGRFGVAPTQTAVDLFEEGLEDALAGATDRDTFDKGLFEIFSRFSWLFEQGVESVEIVNGRTIPIDFPGVERMLRLRRQIPEPQAVRIAGKLEIIGHSDRVFFLELESGEVIKGVAEHVEPAQLAALFGKRVVVSGLAEFRPSGSVSRIEVERMQEASARESSLWSRPPRPLQLPLDVRALRVAQDERSGLNAIYGQWPGDESEAELVTALEEFS